MSSKSKQYSRLLASTLPFPTLAYDGTMGEQVCRAVYRQPVTTHSSTQTHAFCSWWSWGMRACIAHISPGVVEPRYT